jgi:hypothetical protein
MFAYKIAGLAEVVLVVMEHSGYLLLPLGGGQIQQIGLVFATAHIVSESVDLLTGIGPKYAALLRKLRRLSDHSRK